MKNTLYSQLESHQIIAIVRGVATEQMSELFEALYDGGIRLAEITLNTDNALESISNMREQFGDRMSVGAGSVLNEDMARAAISAGAQFLVSPNVDEGMIDYALSQDVLPLPGAMTATEIVQAVQFGAPAVKIFPCSSLGAGYVKELQGPLSHVPMIAVGGIHTDNIAEYKAAGVIGVGIGGNLVNKEWIYTNQFELISAYAAKLRERLGMKEI